MDRERAFRFFFVALRRGLFFQMTASPQSSYLRSRVGIMRDASAESEYLRANGNLEYRPKTSKYFNCNKLVKKGFCAAGTR